MLCHGIPFFVIEWLGEPGEAVDPAGRLGGESLGSLVKNLCGRSMAKGQSTGGNLREFRSHSEPSFLDLNLWRTCKTEQATPPDNRDIGRRKRLNAPILSMAKASNEAKLQPKIVYSKY